MLDDRHKLPGLGKTLAVCLEVIGHRRSTTLTDLGRDVFGCDAAGLSRRYSGAIAVTSAELSKIIAILELDVDGIFPEDLRLPPEDMRAKLKSLQIGIYGRSVAQRLHSALDRFTGRPAELEILRDTRRGTRFTSIPDAGPAEQPVLLMPGERIRFRCAGPKDHLLLLVDHRLRDGDADLLSPRSPSEWLHPDPSGLIHFPDRSEAMILVKPGSANRRVTALWVTPDFGEGLDQAVSPASTRPDGEAPEFRALKPMHMALLIGALEQAQNGPVAAVRSLTYRTE